MKSRGILNIELAKMVAEIGHGDMIAIVDRGFPLPNSHVKCIDLAIKKNLPKVSDVVDIVLDELVVEQKIFARETIKVSPDFYAEINEIFTKHGTDIEERIVEHEVFKSAVLSGGFNTDEIRVYIRTGEFTLYGNIILVAGVDFS